MTDDDDDDRPDGTYSIVRRKRKTAETPRPAPAPRPAPEPAPAPARPPVDLPASAPADIAAPEPMTLEAPGFDTEMPGFGGFETEAPSFETAAPSFDTAAPAFDDAPAFDGAPAFDTAAGFDTGAPIDASGLGFQPVELPGEEPARESASRKFEPIALPGDPEPAADASPDPLGLDLRAEVDLGAPEPAPSIGGGVSLDLDLTAPPADAGAPGETLSLDLETDDPGPVAALDAIDLETDSVGDLELAEPMASPVVVSSKLDTGGPALDVGERATGGSNFARAAGHADKQTPFKRILPPAEEPWLKRKMWHLVGLAILLLGGSYIYGCTVVMGDSVGFRRDMPEVENELAKLEQTGPLTPSRVKQAVQIIADRHDMKVGKVDVLAEEVGNVRQAMGGGCSPRNWPTTTIMKLHPIDQANLAKAGQYCGYPEYILSIRAEVSERWGLFKREFEEVAFVQAHTFQPDGAAAGP